MVSVCCIPCVAAVCTVFRKRNKRPDQPGTTYFKAFLFQVICRDCSTNLHIGHDFESIPRAARKFSETIRASITSVKVAAEQSEAAITRLEAASAQFERQCTRVQNEVEEFIEAYIAAVKRHRDSLLQQIKEVKADNCVAIAKQQQELEKQVNDVKAVVSFANELLNEADGVEVLSLAGIVLRKLNSCSNLKDEELKISTSLQFLPKEVATNSTSSCPLYGVISRQTVSPKNCILNIESESFNQV